VVESELPVLIRGESGTGKELIARAIHAHGTRAKAPFITENCAALPDSLLESELFGHARGAFTGAERAKKGLIEQASGGTLFLDEIGDMSTEMQKKLLRVLQEGEVRPLGSDQRVSVDVRLVAASHRDLADMVAKGEFRQDLFYRVCVLELDLPPLRGRREDVPLLARALLERAAKEVGREAPAISSEALDLLCAYHWPGNVRELENEMRRIVVLGSDAVLAEHLSEQVRHPERPPSRTTELFDAIDGDLRSAVAEFERRAIQAALAKHEGNKSRAASELGLSRFALQRKLEKYEADAGGEGSGSEAEGADTAT
jgi:two-component system response regulator HupR/HoxA